MQHALSVLAFPFVVGLVRFYLKYRRRIKIRNRSRARRRFREFIGRRIPTIICANHLTMFDSVYLHYALTTWPIGMFRNRWFPWNIAAREVFMTTTLHRAITYLGKCIPIDREGEPDHHAEILAKYRFLLSRGQLCIIFPEGARSRTGRVDMDNLAYGVGTILKDLEEYQVICVYLRAEHLNRLATQPVPGDTLYLALECIRPTTAERGLRAARDLTLQIARRLKEMEDAYFAATATDAAGQ